MQCPLCGREVAELVSGLCSRCVSERKPFLDAPEVIDVTRCAHCEKLDRGGTFVPAPSDRDEVVRMAIPHAVDVDPTLSESQLDVDIDWEDERNAVATLRLSASFMGHPVERSGESRIRLKQTACPDCSRRYGGYFEAILQVRSDDERVLRIEGDRLLERIEAAFERYREEQRGGAYASKSERVRGGFDFYMGSQEVARLVARELADRYGAEYAESSKLVGKRDGRDLLRFTLLVRLPPYMPGDFILYDGRAYKVLHHEKRLISLWDLERGTRVQKDPKRAKQLKVIGFASDERDAVVVSYRESSLQLLDPVTLKTIDLTVEGDGFASRETVRVFRYEENLFVLPDAAR